jgi:hypothetical protein
MSAGQVKVALCCLVIPSGNYLNATRGPIANDIQEPSLKHQLSLTSEKDSLPRFIKSHAVRRYGKPPISTDGFRLITAVSAGMQSLQRPQGL